VRHVKPNHNVNCHICNPASSLRIFAEDLLPTKKSRNKATMVLLVFFADTLAIKDEDKDYTKWSEETKRKCGLCNVGFYFMTGPIDSGKEFDHFTTGLLFFNKDLCVYGPLRQEANMRLPERSFKIVHEDFKDEFESRYGFAPNLVMKRNGVMNVGKNVITAEYFLLCYNVVQAPETPPPSVPRDVTDEVVDDFKGSYLHDIINDPNINDKEKETTRKTHKKKRQSRRR
jgi:hypothetical protein